MSQTEERGNYLADSGCRSGLNNRYAILITNATKSMWLTFRDKQLLSGPSFSFFTIDAEGWPLLV